MTNQSIEPTNHLLSSLPPDERSRLLSILSLSELKPGAVLNRLGEPAPYVYFPTTGVVSLVTHLADGSGVEAATIGNEGIVGLPALLESRQAPIEARVQIPGDSLRMASAKFTAALPRMPALSALLLDYTRVLFLFVAQGTACNRRHDVIQRCARWLLTSHDRTARDEFPLTHESIGEMLGVRRASVTEAVGKLRAEELIDSHQGSVHIVDRAGLERRSCECYQVVRELFKRLALKG